MAFLVLRVCDLRHHPAASTTSFIDLVGGLNLAALVLLLGIKGTCALSLFALVLWALLRLASKHKKKSANVQAFAIALIAVASLLFWQKVISEIASVNSPNSPFIGSLRLLTLVSFSYVALRAWDAVCAVRDGEQLLNPLALSAYLAPFFMMPAGPIGLYRDHLEVDEFDSFALPDWMALLRGAEMIVCGLFMKFVLAEGLRLFFTGLDGSLPVASYWDSLVTFFYIYLDFAGYSLIALGIGRLLGVPTPVNFDRPLLATSLTDFWTRWHMSLGNWVKRNIYFPTQLFLLRRTPENLVYLANTLGLLAGFAFVGMWHRLTLPFLVWGILFGCVLSIEKVLRDKVMLPLRKRYPKIELPMRAVAPFYVIAVVVAILHITAMGQMAGSRG